MLSKFAALLQRPKGAQTIRTGGLFRHVGSGNMVETAYVLEVGKDPMGIPHVQYAVLVEQTPESGFKEQRTLGLESFADRYSEAVTA